MFQELTPAPDPLEAAARLHGLPCPILLDSAARDPRQGRYSFFGADPVLVLRATGREVRLTARSGRQRTVNGNVLDVLRALLEPLRRDPAPGLPPFQGGAAGYLAYGFGGVLERLPTGPPRDVAAPDAVFGLYDWVIAWDHADGRAWIISTGIGDEGGAPSVARATERLREVREWLAHPPPPRTGPATPPGLAGPVHAVAGAPAGITSTFSAEAYRAAVRRVVAYILAGDVFQVNLSQRFQGPVPDHPLDLYRRLRTRNPAPFAAYLDLGGPVLVSASPERFLRFDPATRAVETRPIKGTRPRGRTPGEDAARRQDLLQSPKDRAENVMIVDLLRNDLSRVCDPGSVEVPRLLELEVHPTVLHLVSTVTGRLRDGLDAGDLLAAAFPGGSVTGAPKIRAMEIIAELEPTARGPYCGSIGYWSLTGALDTNIVIRTCLVEGGMAWFQAGGGIVADSDPDQEYRETLDKAAAMMAALR